MAKRQQTKQKPEQPAPLLQKTPQIESIAEAVRKYFEAEEAADQIREAKYEVRRREGVSIKMRGIAKKPRQDALAKIIESIAAIQRKGRASESSKTSLVWNALLDKVRGGRDPVLIRAIGKNEIEWRTKDGKSKKLTRKALRERLSRPKAKKT